MANLVKLEFTTLPINGSNYLSWVLDAEMYLNIMNLGNTIKRRKCNDQSRKSEESHDFPLSSHSRGSEVRIFSNKRSSYVVE